MARTPATGSFKCPHTNDAPRTARQRLNDPSPELQGGAPARLGAALSDRYRIERELGTGGMATVYLARDLKHEREVAIKLLHDRFTHQLGAERFLSEIKTTARLRHPNILPLFDSGVIGEDRDALMYYVMPFVDGVSLRDRLTADHQLPIDEAVRIATQVSDALEYAHQHGVIHRDIKPENILLEGGHALVADFGIALSNPGAGAGRLTQTGMALGTPAYMSPEQSAGERDIDARSDLYSVASVLFEMLTGAPPFAGPTVESILVQRFTKAPPRVTTIRATVPRHIDVAVHTAMARDPADRFASVARFAEALIPPVAVPGTGGQVPKSIAVLPFANMSTDIENEYFSDGIAEEIINALTQLPGLRVAARTSAFSFKGKNEDLRGIGEGLNVETVLEGSVRKAGNRVRITAQLINVADGFHFWSERYDRELTDIFAIQDEIATTIAAKLQVTLGARGTMPLVRPSTANVEAYELYLKARPLMRARGRAMFEAVDCFERAIALDPDYAAAHAQLAHALCLLPFWGMLRPDDALPRARRSARRALELDRSLCEAQTAGALVAFLVDFDRDAAEAAWNRAMALDPANVDARTMRAGFLLCYVQGAYAEAITELRAAAANDPLNVYPRAQLAVVLSWARRHAEAEVEALAAVELDAGSSYAHWARLHCYACAGNLPAARAAAEASMARLGRSPWFLMGLANAARNEPDRSVATAVYAELTARSQLEYVQPNVLAVSAIAANRLDDAIRHFTRAAETKDPLLLACAAHSPLIDGIRAHPEWRGVLKRIGL